MYCVPYVRQSDISLPVNFISIGNYRGIITVTIKHNKDYRLDRMKALRAEIVNINIEHVKQEHTENISREVNIR